jgi:hypothetical protein
MKRQLSDEEYPPLNGNPVSILVSAWIGVSATVVISGWCFSFLGILGLVWIPDAFALLAGIVLVMRSYPAVSAAERNVVLRLFLSPPFLLLGGLILAAIVCYPPVTYDSVSYRLPRILLWLQEGRIAHLPVSDERINSMTHVWELLTLPVVKVWGESLPEATSFIGWVMTILISFDFARRLGADERKAVWMAMIPASAFGCVLQAAGTSNDLLATAFVLASAWFAVSSLDDHATRRWCTLMSALSLALAAGTKPHFMVLGLPWCLWFVISPGAPWRSLRWFDPLWAVPSGLLLSALPALILNKIHYGRMTGPNEIMEGSHEALVNLAASASMVIWQQLQLPLNPLAAHWNEIQRGWVASSSWHEKVPKLGFGMSEIPLADNASLGIAVFAVLLYGFLLAIRNKRRVATWCWWCMASGLAAFCLAGSKVVPATIGRSFLGFLMLAAPVSLAGLMPLKISVIRRCSWICAVFAAIVLAITPTHPLWPAAFLLGNLQSSGTHTSLQSRISKYVSFTERHDAGKDLIDLVNNDKPLGVLAGGGEPLLTVIGRHRGKTIFYAPDTDLAVIEKSDVEWLLVTGLAPELHNAAIDALGSSGLWKRIGSHSYTTELRRGPMIWTLYRRVATDDSDAQ